MKRIFFDNLSGEVILEIQHQNDLLPTVERNIEQFTMLSERNRDTFGVIELENGQYAQDFAESKGYRVNVVTKELEFSYPDPNEPEVPPIYQKSLSEAVSENIDYLLDIDFRLIMIELGM